MRNKELFQYNETSVALYYSAYTFVNCIMQDLNNYKNSLSQLSPDNSLSVYLTALWYDAKGDWDKAHHIIQDVPDKTAAWIHAYLHRKEGDISNADYWYHQASKKRPNISLGEEWESIVSALL
jgi:hypothetical protein